MKDTSLHPRKDLPVAVCGSEDAGVIVNRWTDLFVPGLTYENAPDAFSTIPNGFYLWSGMLTDGSPSLDNCQDFATSDSGYISTTGRTDQANVYFLQNPYLTLSCGSVLSLLCVCV